MKQWIFNSDFIGDEDEQTLRDEFASLNSLLEKLKEIESLECRPIDDVPQDLGLELFFKSKKIAELFCVEYDNNIIQGQYSVFSIVNDFEYIKFTTEECCGHFKNYIDNT